MEYIDIFDDRFVVSYYHNLSDATSTAKIPLRNFLRATFEDNSPYKNKVMYARSLSGDAYKQQKMFVLPNCTIGATCTPKRCKQCATPNGLICVDIDGKDNPHIKDWELFKQQIAVMPQVAFCALSLSGNGVYAILPISHPDKFTDVYKQLEIDFLAANVIIDKACSDISRVRVMSFDSNPYINHAALPYKGVYEQPMSIPHLHINQDADDTEMKVAEYVRQIKSYNLNLTCSYTDWVQIGMALADLGESGRQYFHAVSSIDARYNEAQTNKKFDNFLQKTRDIHIGTFFQMCHDAGIHPKSHTEASQSEIAPHTDKLSTDKEKTPQKSVLSLTDTFELQPVPDEQLDDDEMIEIPIYDEQLKPTKGTHRYPIKDLPQWVRDNPKVRLFSYWNFADKDFPLHTMAISDAPLPQALRV